LPHTDGKPAAACAASCTSSGKKPDIITDDTAELEKS
jgi:hypothetical protein